MSWRLHCFLWAIWYKYLNSSNLCHICCTGNGFKCSTDDVAVQQMLIGLFIILFFNCFNEAHEYCFRTVVTDYCTNGKTAIFNDLFSTLFSLTNSHLHTNLIVSYCWKQYTTYSKWISQFHPKIQHWTITIFYCFFVIDTKDNAIFLDLDIAHQHCLSGNFKFC